jgi:hypothetical protein
MVAAISLCPAPALAQDRDPNLVRADASSNGRTVTLRRGQRLSVSVEACVGCGYGWRLTRLPPNLSLAGMNEVDTNDRSGPNPVVGGGKTMVYNFYVEGAGRGQLILENRQFQGPRGAGAQTVRINVLTR